MRSIRLLPVVIFAALALLLFKGIGLLTNGGYVLTGTETVQAESGHGGAPAEGGGGGEADGVTLSMPSEPTMTDTSPTLADGAPTVGGKSEAPASGGHGAPAAGGHDAPASGGHDAPAAGGEHAAPAPSEGGGHGEPATGEHGEAAAPPPAPVSHGAEASLPDHGSGEPSDLVMPSGDCPLTGHSATTAEIGNAIKDATKGQAVQTTDCPNVDPLADAVPVKKDSKGNLVPLTTSDGTPLSEKELLERLAERRTELDKRESDLAMRESLVEAAEKRIEQRTADLKALEAQITGLVDQKKAMEEEQFKALVAMYGSMKPGEAAKIFNTLEMTVLLPLTKAMSARKMAPILAAMDAQRAQELTVRMAAADTDEPQVTPVAAGGDLANLPQIVGH